MTNIIATAQRRFRAPVSRGSKPVVDRTGGDFGAGIIRGASIVSEGEALGHGAWLDAEFVKSVHMAVNATGKKGLKMRFTHPSLSGDGLGKFLGRAKKSVLRDGKSIVDIHFSKTAHETPDGDLANYVMDMAEEDPDAFGVSIVFEPDIGAEDRFIATNEDEDGNFQSPDKNNLKNYPHARLARLAAADVVDEPAANPDGLFHRGQDIAKEADSLCAFAFGLTTERPTLRSLSVDANRLADFTSRFLDSHNLELKEKNMGQEPNKPEVAAITKADLEAFSASILKAVDEKLSSLKPADADEQPSPEELRKAGAKQAAQIMAFAASSGLKDHEKLANDAIEAGTDVQSFKASLADRLVAANKLSDDAGETGDKDPCEKFRAEFYAQQSDLANYGITDVDSFVRTRCREEGIPVPAKKAS